MEQAHLEPHLSDVLGNLNAVFLND